MIIVVCFFSVLLYQKEIERTNIGLFYVELYYKKIIIELHLKFMFSSKTKPKKNNNNLCVI